CRSRVRPARDRARAARRDRQTISSWCPSPRRAARRAFRLERPDVLRLRALLALLGVVRDLRALAQRAVAVSLDRAVMNEEVLATVVRCDEAEALLVGEPLHGSLCHVFTSTALSAANAEELLLQPAGATRCTPSRVPGFATR